MASPPPSGTSELLTIGLSGAPSAGKTTLLHILAVILNPIFVIQLDDFCKDIDQLPLQPNGVPDADSRDSVDFPAFIASLKVCRETGRLPDTHSSWQKPADLVAAREKALAAIPAEDLAYWKGQVNGWSPEHRRPVGIVDGFLLYHLPDIRDLLDVKFLLRVSKAEALRRRMQRPGYGDPNNKDFWRTERYFEDCVWRNYSKEHAWLFENGDVEDEAIGEELMRTTGVHVQNSLDCTVDGNLNWILSRISAEMCRGILLKE